MEQRLGPAAEALQALLDEGHAESFDLAFIGAPLTRRGFVSATPCMSVHGVALFTTGVACMPARQHRRWQPASAEHTG